jgi:hypothetical protein
MPHASEHDFMDDKIDVEWKFPDLPYELPDLYRFRSIDLITLIKDEQVLLSRFKLGGSATTKTPKVEWRLKLVWTARTRMNPVTSIDVVQWCFRAQAARHELLGLRLQGICMPRAGIGCGGATPKLRQCNTNIGILCKVWPRSMCWRFLYPIEYVFHKRTKSTTVALHLGVF